MGEMSFQELQEIVSICLDEVIRLKEENKQLKENMATYEKTIKEFEIGQKQILENFTNLEKIMTYYFVDSVETLENLEYEIIDERTKVLREEIPHICSVDETIDQLLNERKSMGRYGDGEFAIMSNIYRQKFQRLDEKLAERLKEVIATNEEGFCIAIADNYGNLDEYNKVGKIGIRQYMTEETRKQHWEYLQKDRVYHNTYISRPYAIFADNATDAPRKRFEALKRIWNDRNVIFVEGSKTRLGYKNDLFDNAREIKRIEAPAVSSFDKYDEILSAALHFGKKDTLFLIALGPSAAVLAYDLYKNGFQAIDIGHLDLEYEWFLQGKGGRCEVNYKYNNEFRNGDQVEDIDDEEFNKQILIRIES